MTRPWRYIRPTVSRTRGAFDIVIPLQGLRVLDLSEGIAGPFCTKLLADYGAEVIKVERPGTGDWTRQRPPFYRGEPGTEHSLLFAYLNTSKRSLTLDLESAAGRDMVYRLAAESDILVLSQPLTFLDSLPGGRQALRTANPKLVVSSVPYYEGEGPYANYKATELTLYAMSGLMSMATGDQRGRLKAGGYQAQYMAGAQICSYTLFAALKARRQGTGSFIEASVAECCARVLAHMQSYVPGQSRERSTPIQEGSTWECGEGSLMIMMYYYQMETLGALIGDPTLKSDTSTGADIGMRENRRVWQDPLRAWLKTKTADEAETEAQREHLLFSKVNNTRDVVESEHLNARNFFVDVFHPVIGPARFPIGSYHLTGNDRNPPQAAPVLGEANDFVLRQRLGLTEADLAHVSSARSGAQE